MSSHWSLVLFTLLVQSVIGNVWCLQLAFFFNGFQMDSFYLKFQIIMALGLILVGLAAAMLHLGTPSASFNAVRNVKRSWLSREIFTVNLFAVVLIILTALTLINPDLLNPWMVLGESLIGGLVLYTMTHVYLLRSVPAWNNAGTPFAFLGAALLLGAVLFAILLNIFMFTMNIDLDPKQLVISQSITFAVMSIGLILKILAAGMTLFDKSAHSASLMRRQPVMQTIGFALWVVSMLPTHKTAPFFTVSFLAAVFLAVGEVIHRIQFYNNYQRVGL